MTHFDDTDWEGHPDIQLSEDEVAEIIAQDYAGGKWAWR